MVYECAKYVNLPARTTIFEQGDIGEKMYVILKGRVAVEVTAENSDIPVVVALLKDGEHFGELGLIDQNRIDEQSLTEKNTLHDTQISSKNKYARRKASCITAEDSAMLILDKSTCYALYQSEQEEKNKKQQ